MGIRAGLLAVPCRPCVTLSPRGRKGGLSLPSRGIQSDQKGSVDLRFCPHFPSKVVKQIPASSCEFGSWGTAAPFGGIMRMDKGPCPAGFFL